MNQFVLRSGEVQSLLLIIVLQFFRRRCNYGTWTTETRSRILSVEGTAKEKYHHLETWVPMIHKPAYLVDTKLLALLLNHYNTVFCMSSCDENVQPLWAFFNGLKMWKSHGDMQGVWHCPQHAIRRFLNSVRHKEAGTVVQQGDASNVFTHKRSEAIPCDFLIFGPLWKPSNSRRATTCRRLWQWFTQPPTEFCAHEICRLVHQRDSCLNACCDFLWRNICTRVHPQMGFSYDAGYDDQWVCLIHIWKPRACGDTYRRRHFTQKLSCIY